MSSTAPSAPAKGLSDLLPGVLFAAALGAAAFLLAEVPWVKGTLHWSALLIVILLGIAWKSALPVPAIVLPGVRFAQRPILRWAVAGLGFRLSVVELWSIGGSALVVVVVGTVTSLFFGWWIARRLGVPEKMGLLLGVGGAICGASAVVAADTVVQGEKRDSALSLGVITLLGTIGILLYPLIGRALGIGEFVYGVFDGASLHEMAQVVAAGETVGKEALRVATVVKLARISLLAPVVVYLGWSLRRRHVEAGQAKVAPVPWFLVLFVLFAGIKSTGWVPRSVVDVILKIDVWLLCVGMAGVGLQTGFKDLKEAGWRPIAAGALQWAFLAAVTLGLAIWLCTGAGGR